MSKTVKNYYWNLDVKQIKMKHGDNDNDDGIDLNLSVKKIVFDTGRKIISIPF